MFTFSALLFYFFRVKTNEDAKNDVGKVAANGSTTTANDRGAYVEELERVVVIRGGLGSIGPNIACAGIRVENGVREVNAVVSTLLSLLLYARVQDRKRNTLNI